MPDWTGQGVSPARFYRDFAASIGDEAPSYVRLALGVAHDDELLARLARLPPATRQPNLLFGAVRYLDGPVEPFAAFREWALGHWGELAAVMLDRRTQTNEARRCAVLLPALAGLAGADPGRARPLALIEVGASAGLCLLPDRYAYRYLGPDGVVDLGRSTLTLECAVSGPAPLPRALPAVAWRAGLDLHPLDVRREEDVRWLRALIWPEQHERFAVFDAAVAIARADPPPVRAGDLRHDLPALVDRARREAPADARIVVFHTAVLAYLDPGERAGFAATMAELSRDAGVAWLSNEQAGIVPGTEDVAGLGFVLAASGHPLAVGGGHGQSLRWLAGPR